MRASHISFLLLLIITTYNSFAQIKRIKFKNEYEHSSTNTVFPKSLLRYELDEVNAFDKKKENVCVEYKSPDSDNNTKISIYIYPAYSGYDGRLRNEYLNALVAINCYSKNKREFQFDHTKIEDENYIVNGLKTSFTDDDGNNSELSIYECGTWFFKVRITSNKLTNIEIDTLEKEVVKKYSPTKLTALKPLNLRGNVQYSKMITRDTLLLTSAMVCSFKKLEWGIKNVSEKEKKSGFPDLYLKMHIEAINKFIDWEAEQKDNHEDKIQVKRTNKQTGDFIDNLKKIRAAGYLEEYIAESLSEIIIADDIVLDMTGYKEWKKDNTIPEFLFPKFFEDSYLDK